ncbi:MAG: response regulator [Candidatus Aquicultorales bacterium]
MDVAVELVLVEDKEADAELIIRVLRKNNLANNIILLKDGAEALDFFFAKDGYADRPVDDAKMLLLDLKLPKVDGLEVLRQIKKDKRTKNIPVVVLSASEEERDLDKAYELGANGYVVKPIKFEDFSRIVRDLGIFWLLVNKRPAG